MGRCEAPLSFHRWDAPRSERRSLVQGVDREGHAQGAELRSLSWENDELKNGVFTKAVLWALTGSADDDSDGAVTTDELRRYVARTVAERTGGRQNPTVDRDNVTVRIALPVVRDPAALAVLTRDDPTVAPVAPVAPKPPSVRPPAACGCRVQGAGERSGGVLAGVVVGLALALRRWGRSRRAV